MILNYLLILLIFSTIISLYNFEEFNTCPDSLNCLFCNPNYKYCRLCKSGYYRDNEFKCSPCNDSNCEYCYDSTVTSCIRCKKGYYLSRIINFNIRK